MQTLRISSNQIAMLTGCFLSAGMIVSTSKEMVYQAGQDAWTGYFFPMVYGALIIVISIWLYKGREGITLFELNKKLLGGIGGSLLNLVLFWYLLSMLITDLRKLAEFVKTTLLLNTPVSVTMFMILLLTVYLTRGGIEVIARVGHLYFFLLAATIVSLPILLINEFSLANVRPVMANGLEALAKSSFMAVGSYGEVIAMISVMFAFSYQKNPKGLHPMLRGVVFGTFLLTVLSVTLIGTVGTSISARAMYPNLMLVQSIHITDFLDRLDIILVSFWVPSYIIKICLNYYVLTECISSIPSEKQNPKAYTIVLVPLVFMMGHLSFESVVELVHFETHVWSFVTVFLQVVLFSVLIVARLMRDRQRKKEVELT
ncbi:GerAB/ArcD/ProY family transporter [Brevibacillus dissolubilis]|uniref:GerAB/ArcD/ProY family transporter n=1 Tax=Brevibacillus dissolubilis TaxID=1844116 RepID=UPI0011160F3B|nr:endospore germination permease [Brevibacillus dissolubilis]